MDFSGNGHKKQDPPPESGASLRGSRERDRIHLTLYMPGHLYFIRPYLTIMTPEMLPCICPFLRPGLSQRRKRIYDSLPLPVLLREL